MSSGHRWKLLTKVGAASLALFLAIPMALRPNSVFRIYCYAGAALAVAVCLLGASRLRDEKAATASSDGALLADPPVPSEAADGDSGAIGDGSD